MQGNEAPTSSKRDCLSCKISGFGTLASVGAYFLIIEGRKASTPQRKRFVTITGAG